MVNKGYLYIIFKVTLQCTLKEIMTKVKCKRHHATYCNSGNLRVEEIHTSSTVSFKVCKIFPRGR